MTSSDKINFLQRTTGLSLCNYISIMSSNYFTIENEIQKAKLVFENSKFLSKLLLRVNLMFLTEVPIKNRGTIGSAQL